MCSRLQNKTHPPERRSFIWARNLRQFSFSRFGCFFGKNRYSYIAVIYVEHLISEMTDVDQRMYSRCMSILQTYRTYRYDLRNRERAEAEHGFKKRIISKYEVRSTCEPRTTPKASSFTYWTWQKQILANLLFKDHCCISEKCQIRHMNRVRTGSSKISKCQCQPNFWIPRGMPNKSKSNFCRVFILNYKSHEGSKHTQILGLPKLEHQSSILWGYISAKIHYLVKTGEVRSGKLTPQALCTMGNITLNKNRWLNANAVQVIYVHVQTVSSDKLRVTGGQHLGRGTFCSQQEDQTIQTHSHTRVSEEKNHSYSVVLFLGKIEQSETSFGKCFQNANVLFFRAKTTTSVRMLSFWRNKKN